jgi:hypothetical protein
MTCCTCQRIRKAAFAAIRTVLPSKDEKDKKKQEDGRAGSVLSELSR